MYACSFPRMNFGTFSFGVPKLHLCVLKLRLLHSRGNGFQNTASFLRLAAVRLLGS